MHDPSFEFSEDSTVIDCGDAGIVELPYTHPGWREIYDLMVALSVAASLIDKAVCDGRV